MEIMEGRSEIKKITKISIFIDYDNFVYGYKKRYEIEKSTSRDKVVNIKIWEKLNQVLLAYYESYFIKKFETTDLVATYLCVGLSDIVDKKEAWKREIFKKLDRIPGFIVRYGYRSCTDKTDDDENFILGKEKGVDTEIVCQMLVGAFLNHYDACILVSDDGDYLPAVRRIEDYFGKKVIQAGFNEKCRMRNQAYGHIPLWKTEEIDLKVE